MSLYHHQVNSRFVEEPRRPSGGHGRAIPPEYIRQQARVSREGGMGYCADCGYRFSMTHLVWVYRRPFTCEETVCKDCQKVRKYARSR